MATSTKLPANPFLHEILALVSKQRTKAKKIEVLKQYECDATLTPVSGYQCDHNTLF